MQLVLYRYFQIMQYASLQLKGLQIYQLLKLEVKKMEVHEACDKSIHLKNIEPKILGFFNPSNLTACSFSAPWATRMHNISFESPI